MRKILQTESKLTDRYQTTIPEPIREALHLGKRDKITYILQDNGKVLISRANEDDPLLQEFLTFIAKDIQNNPTHIQNISQTLLTRARLLVANVEIDLDSPLSDQDE